MIVVNHLWKDYQPAIQVALAIERLYHWPDFILSALQYFEYEDPLWLFFLPSIIVTSAVPTKFPCESRTSISNVVSPCEVLVNPAGISIQWSVAFTSDWCKKAVLPFDESRTGQDWFANDDTLIIAKIPIKTNIFFIFFTHALGIYLCIWLAIIIKFIPSTSGFRGK